MALREGMLDRARWVGQYMTAHRSEYHGGRNDASFARVAHAAQEAYNTRRNPGPTPESGGEHVGMEIGTSAVGTVLGLAAFTVGLGVFCTWASGRIQRHRARWSAYDVGFGDRHYGPGGQ